MSHRSSLMLRRILASRSHFETLELPTRHLACSEVRASFLSLAKQVHPDQCKEKDAEAAFRKVSEAYEALRCPQRRTAHLEFVRHQTQRDPQTALAAMDALAKPWLLGVFVGLFFAAELIRIAFAEDKSHIQVVPVVAQRPNLPPVAPGFSSSPGEALVGPSQGDVVRKLDESLRARRRRREMSNDDR